MSPSEHRLQVTAGDEVAEISVIDGSWNTVARAVGHLDQTFAAGLYKLQVRVGSHLDEQLVALDQDRTLQFAAPDIPSAIPLESSSRSHEYHRDAAAQAGASARDSFGAGASILVFARDWTPGGSAAQNNPAAGLSLLDDNGAVLASIERRADVRLNGDPSAGWRGDVAPGSYRLRLDLPDGTSQERTLYAAPKTQTQIFLLQRDYTLSDGKTERRSDLAAGAVAISMSFGFDSRSSHARQSELACYALTQTRHVLSDALLKKLLEGKFENPMLGILGAHLVLRDHPKDTRLFKMVTDNLLQVLGAEHPDLKALWLRRDERGGIDKPQLSTPPMLRRSWDLATEESIRNPDIIPAHSPSDTVMLRIMATAPWLVWQGDGIAAAATAGPNDKLATTAAALANLLATRAHSDADRASASADRAWARQGTMQRLSTSLQALPSKVRSFAFRTPEPASPSPPKPSLSEDDKVEIARVLGVSGRAIDDALQRLFS